MTVEKYKENKKEPIAKHKQSLQMLKDFGLTENEAMIYTFLLEKGIDVGGSKIAIGTGMHRQYVYLSITRLIDLNLVEAVEYGKQKKYKALPPNQIEKIAKKRVFEAEDIVKELNTFSTVGHEQDFEVIQGNQAIQRYEISYAKHASVGECEYIIGGNLNGFEETMEDTLDDYINIKDEKKMKVFYIGASFLEIERYKNQKSFNVKILDGLPQGVTHMVIRKKEVLFFSFLKPKLLYVIKSQNVADNYKDFFDLLWNMAK